MNKPDPLQDKEEFELGGDARNITFEDWQEVARLVPNLQLPEEPADLLGRRDIDLNYDWNQHVGCYWHEEFVTRGY